MGIVLINVLLMPFYMLMLPFAFFGLLILAPERLQEIWQNIQPMLDGFLENLPEILAKLPEIFALILGVIQASLSGTF